MALLLSLILASLTLTGSFQDEIDAGRLPGVVMLLAKDGEVVSFEALGFRDRQAGAPMTKDVIFRMASMTKPFTSVAAMMLVEEGKMSLTDKVSKYLPILKNEEGVTIQDLLRHTSGLVHATGNDPISKALRLAHMGGGTSMRDLTSQEQLERLSLIPLAYPPGTFWAYGLSTNVLGMVVEVVSGKRLGAFLEERLFKPLKMVDTGFYVPKEKQGRLASRSDCPACPDVTVMPKSDGGGAGAVSTASDYFRFCQMLLNGGELEGVRVLRAATVALMTSDQLGDIPGYPLPGYSFGLGFSVNKESLRYGWAGAYGTYFFVYPKEKVVGIMLTQKGGALRVSYRKLFIQSPTVRKLLRENR